MNGLTIDELRARHAHMQRQREDAAREAREQDLGFAYVLGELEQLIALLEAREKGESDAGNEAQDPD